jgi:general L-amino acid transport system permease protein
MSRRDVVLQFLMLVLLGLGLSWLVSNVTGNLERQNIASGFGFLNERAGFGISQTLIEYTEDDTYQRVLIIGLLNTLLVSVIGIVLASVLGFVIGVARLSSNWLISKIAMVYIEIFRNVPLLLQIMFWYFGVLRNLPSPRRAIEIGDSAFLSNRGIVLPGFTMLEGAGWYVAALAISLTAWFVMRRRAHKKFLATGTPQSYWRVLALGAGTMFAIAYAMAGFPFAADVPALHGFNFRGGVNIIPEFAALLLALSLYTAAFISEIVRSGIVSVGQGQREAAAALGLSNNTTLRLVIIPQAMRVIIPPLTSQYLNLTKNSSLAVAIAYPDIVSVFAGTTLTQIGQAVEIIFITMMVYLSLSLLTSWAMNSYNKRIALVGQNA